MKALKPRQGIRLSGRREPIPGGSDTAVRAVYALEPNPLPRPPCHFQGNFQAKTHAFLNTLNRLEARYFLWKRSSRPSN